MLYSHFDRKAKLERWYFVEKNCFLKVFLLELSKTMPQLRKRKTKEIVSEEVEKKIKEDISRSNARKKEGKGTLSSSIDNKKPRKSTKRRKNDSAFSSDDESYRLPPKKNIAKNSTRKDPIVGKEIVLRDNIKNESNDSHNSFDSGISSKVCTDAIKVDTKVENVDVCKPSTSLLNHNEVNDEASASESEWEEVEDNCETLSLDDYKPDIPKEGVEIIIDCPELKIRKRKKRQFDENEWIRLHINRIRKDIQLSIHKTHLLCLLAHGMYVNEILNSNSIKALALSLVPVDILSYASGKKADKIGLEGLGKIVSWFCETFEFEKEKCLFLNFLHSMTKNFEEQKARNPTEYNLMFIVIARILGFKVRLCVSLYPITYKATNLIKKQNGKKNLEKASTPKEKKECETSNKEPKKAKSKKVKANNVKKIVNKEKDVQEKNENISRPRRSKGKSYKFSSDEDDNDDDDKNFELLAENMSDDDFKNTHKNSSKIKQRSSSTKERNRKVLSSDSEPPSPQNLVLESGNVICWAEVFSKFEKQWICIECSNNVIDKPYDIEALAPKPVSYILAYDNNSYVKDVTRRYCNEYMTSTIKLRVDPDWWDETLDPFLPPNSQQDKAEEKKLDDMLVNKPLPKTIQGFKNHPLYALKRHLLKFEAIYPPDAPPVGFMKEEPIYARDCVHQLHSRETWLKEARVVKIGEEPYKIVKARPKWDRMAGVMRTDLPLEIFGHWQTEEYKPPVAINGKVPRNEYGNVELFKPCMLPKGTVHLQLPGLNRIAKKLNIDCSPAVVGFDGHKGSVHPVFDGFIVCKEFRETLLAAWDEEQENARKREEEKREKRIYGNWKKLIKGLLIRERIKLKYNIK